MNGRIIFVLTLEEKKICRSYFPKVQNMYFWGNTRKYKINIEN